MQEFELWEEVLEFYSVEEEEGEEEVM